MGDLGSGGCPFLRVGQKCLGEGVIRRICDADSRWGFALEAGEAAFGDQVPKGRVDVSG